MCLKQNERMLYLEQESRLITGFFVLYKKFLLQLSVC